MSKKEKVIDQTELFREKRRASIMRVFNFEAIRSRLQRMKAGKEAEVLKIKP